jgi:hypothetical protein
LKNQIGLLWEKASVEGGTPVIDYQISYAENSGVYVILASSITVTTYTATDLTAGTTYKFTVKARNAYGFSDSSDEILILAA